MNMEIIPPTNGDVLQTDTITAIPDTPLPAAQPATRTPIASEPDLERYASQPMNERSLTPPLRGVLMEVALTGIIRYNWALLRPLVEHLVEQTLREYESSSLSADMPGPTRPAFHGESLGETINRFKSVLSRFSNAPWTLQRLCEVLLAPRNQYTQLHKVAVAIEKCLMVTGEIALSADPPALPCLEDMTRPINSNPPQPIIPPKGAAAQSSHGAANMDMDVENSNAFTSTLLEVQGPPPGADNGNEKPGSPPYVSNNPRMDVSNSSTAVGSPPPAGHGSGGHTSHGNHGSHHGSSSVTSHHHTSGGHGHPIHAAHAAHNPGSRMEHLEEDHWPDMSVAKPGHVAPLHGLAGHGHASSSHVHHHPSIHIATTHTSSGTPGTPAAHQPGAQLLQGSRSGMGHGNATSHDTSLHSPPRALSHAGQHTTDTHTVQPGTAQQQQQHQLQADSASRHEQQAQDVIMQSPDTGTADDNPNLPGVTQQPCEGMTSQPESSSSQPAAADDQQPVGMAVD